MIAERPFLRFPTIAGDLLAFACDDDVWIVSISTPTARRLSADHEPVSNLRLSPGGRAVAYTGRRDGAPEAYVVALDGGPARRITYWGDPFTRVIGWRNEDEVLVISAVGEPFRSRTWAYAVPADGGPAERLGYGPITGFAAGPDGAVVLGRDQSPSRGASWKRYRGGTAAKLWIDVAGSGAFERFLGGLDGQLEDPGWIEGRVVFVSDHEGVGNVYSVLPDGSDLRRHSDHAEFYARAAHSDGARLTYQCAGDLYLVEDLSPVSTPRRIEVELGGARSGATAFPIRASEHLGEVAPERTGRASAVEVRGSIVWLTHRDGPARVLGGGGPVRARLPRVLGSERVAWVTDADGEDAIEIGAVLGRDSGERVRIGAGRLGRVLELSASPDGALLGVATHDGRVVVVEAASGTITQIDQSLDDNPSGLSFSPDSSWLAWSHAGPEPLRQIRMARVQGEGSRDILEVTPMRFDDHDPVFTLDGRYLAFLSARTFDPVYDSHVFDLFFPAATRPYVVALASSTPSPFGAELEGRALRPGDDADAGHEDDHDGHPPPIPLVVVDPENLAERVVAVPVPAARYRQLRAAEGGLLWINEPLVGVLGDERAKPDAEVAKPTLVRYDFGRRRQLTLADSARSVEVTGDGKSVVVIDGESLFVAPSTARVEPPAPGGEGASERVDVDTGRIRLQVDPMLEWHQMFDEAARLMRDHFWIEDMADVDWAGVVARYRPLVARISTRSELSELFWEVQGELGSSHAYEEPPARPVDELRRLGLLGADLARGEDGRWRVRAVLPGESSVPAARAPLLAPGASVAVGEAIVAVDGVEVDPRFGPAAALVGAANRPVALGVEGIDGQRRDVVVTPLSDERPLRYQAWVADRRSAVHAATAGRAGYLHVPDMMGNGWAQLHRDLRVEVARESLIVDLRDNAGGHVSQLVVEKLARTVLGWDIVRHHNAETYPADAPRGPLVAVVNEQAGSDGDIVTAAIKLRRLGPVIGTRTWGGVIGIDGRYSLVDGTRVTQPRYAFWFEDLGWEVENHGVDPDIEVPIPPQAWPAGEDPQLDRALVELSALLELRPAASPPDPATRPSRRPPPLPPRP